MGDVEVVLTTPEGAIVATARSDEDGRAHVELAPGRYIVNAEDRGDYVNTPQRTFVVRVGATTHVPLTFTNGIQ